MDYGSQFWQHKAIKYNDEMALNKVEFASNAFHLRPGIGNFDLPPFPLPSGVEFSQSDRHLASSRSLSCFGIAMQAMGVFGRLQSGPSPIYLQPFPQFGLLSSAFATTMIRSDANMKRFMVIG